ncbi:MAG TPA: DUF507 family protein [Candidatus Dormibacteraeota bacterium]|nr:DUF507 family protein [Candidatus Dormibacteraeota bacterium]
MRLSREKINRLGHVVTDVLVSDDGVQFVEDRDTIRQNVIKFLQDLMKQEELIDAQVRNKITSQKKEILEGTAEWDILYRKYYADEMKKLGIAETSRS